MPTVSVDAVPPPIGTVDSTLTPGAAISTSALYCEKLAHCLFSSIAATDTTLLYEAGYERALVPALPAAAIDSTPLASRVSKARCSVFTEREPPSDMLMTLAPAALHLLAAVVSVDE